MNILVLGGDGYLGWPTAMHLSRLGHQVMAVDNYFRRNECKKLGLRPLFSEYSLEDRAKIWHERSGSSVGVAIGDITDYQFLERIIRNHQPDAIVHYAEQPSAPYSMMGRDQALFTIRNNIIGTANVVYAVKENAPGCHIVKLGTMGEYGTPNIDIEEGYIEIEHKGRRDRFLYPRQANSLYHTTKIQDTDLLYLYVRIWGLRVTDLMQGPVYGIFTGENELDERLRSFFNYDAVFGTVLNRFVAQAACGHPLTVYGKGNQKRGYLDIRDTLRCVELAIQHPAKGGELRIFNQFTETFSVNELAVKVREAAEEMGIRATIEHIPNPRKEDEDHYYNATNQAFMKLGLRPHHLTQATLKRMLEAVSEHRNEIERTVLEPRVVWS